MRVLFICNEYYPIQSAASNCVQSIVSVLKQYGVEIAFINVSGRLHKAELTTADGYKILHVFNPCGFSGSRSSLLKHPGILFAKLISKLIRNIFKFTTDIFSTRAILHALKKHGEKYEILISVVADINNAVACAKYCAPRNKRHIIYQVDPISTNYVMKDRKKRLYKLEKKLYASADKIITTPIIAAEKANDSSFDLSRVYPLEFPNVKDRTQSSGNVKNTIYCAFCGYIYNKVRDSEYTLKLFSHIRSEVQLTFVGSGQEDLIRRFEENDLKGRITQTGVRSADESFKFMADADFLINIGNIMTNQVPSKLFDYISTGKPIINICKNKDCPTIPYLEKYELAINLIEDEDHLCEQAEKLERFIFENLGKQKPYAFIESRFRENTAEYVGRCFYEIIEGEVIKE